MSKGPKKIWWRMHGPLIGWADLEENVSPDDIPYIRADIVDELMKALEIIKAKVCGDLNPNWHDGDARFASRAFIADVAEAALKKLEDV